MGRLSKLQREATESRLNDYLRVRWRQAQVHRVTRTTSERWDQVIVLQITSKFQVFALKSQVKTDKFQVKFQVLNFEFQVLNKS